VSFAALTIGDVAVKNLKYFGFDLLSFFSGKCIMPSLTYACLMQMNLCRISSLR